MDRLYMIILFEREEKRERVCEEERAALRG